MKYLFQLFITIPLLTLLVNCIGPLRNPTSQIDNENCIELKKSSIYPHSSISSDANESNNPLIERWGTWESYQTELQNIIEESKRSSTDDLIPCPFLPYIKNYQAIKNSPIRPDIKFVFKDLQEFNEHEFQQFEESDVNKIGECTFTDRIVVIDYTVWQISDSSVRQILLFHELGHCDLDQEDHNDNNQPAIMNTDISDTIKYIRFLDGPDVRNLVNDEEVSHCKLEFYQELFDNLESKQKSDDVCFKLRQLFSSI